MNWFGGMRMELINQPAINLISLLLNCWMNSVCINEMNSMRQNTLHFINQNSSAMAAMNQSGLFHATSSLLFVADEVTFTITVIIIQKANCNKSSNQFNWTEMKLMKLPESISWIRKLNWWLVWWLIWFSCWMNDEWWLARKLGWRIKCGNWIPFRNWNFNLID